MQIAQKGMHRMCIRSKRIQSTESIKYSDGTITDVQLIAGLFNKLDAPVKAKIKEVLARMKAFFNDLLLAIRSFIELLAPLLNLELIFKSLENERQKIPELVFISLRDYIVIDKQYSDEYQA